MSPVRVVDGKLRFGVNIDDFYNNPHFVQRLQAKGMLKIPAQDDVDTIAQPALARINPLDGMTRWIAECPDCKGSEYVWIFQPRFLCVGCANRSINFKWRMVELPQDRSEIEGSILIRPNWINRAWEPGETLEAVRKDTAELIRLDIGLKAKAG